MLVVFISMKQTFFDLHCALPALVLNFPSMMLPDMLSPRGPATEWYDALQPFLLLGPTVRHWFADNVFLKNRDRFSEYLLECPSAEVRIIVHVHVH